MQEKRCREVGILAKHFQLGVQSKATKSFDKLGTKLSRLGSIFSHTSAVQGIAFSRIRARPQIQHSPALTCQGRRTTTRYCWKTRRNRFHSGRFPRNDFRAYRDADAHVVLATHALPQTKFNLPLTSAIVGGIVPWHSMQYDPNKQNICCIKPTAFVRQPAAFDYSHGRNRPCSFPLTG